MQCEDFGKHFQNKFKLIDHKKHHRKEYCEICKVEVSKNNFKGHQIEKHTDVDKNMSSAYQCDICLKSFARNSFNI